jgi:hypothetical protein
MRLGYCLGEPSEDVPGSFLPIGICAGHMTHHCGADLQPRVQMVSARVFQWDVTIFPLSTAFLDEGLFGS